MKARVVRGDADRRLMSESLKMGRLAKKSPHPCCRLISKRARSASADAIHSWFLRRRMDGKIVR